MTRAGLAGLALLLLGACSAAPVRPLAPDPAAAAGLDHWHATGRLAVRTAQDGFSAHFDWRQTGPAGVLDVRGPFGAGAVRLTVATDHIRVESGADAPLEIAAPYTALEPTLVARLGFPLPLESLRYWMLGVPAPTGLPTADGAGFEQDGWRVAASDYLGVDGAPAPLPGRLELTRGTTRIRVVVDRWQAVAP